MHEVTIRLLLVFMTAALFAIRIYFSRKVAQTRQKKNAFQKLVIIASAAWILSLIVYSFGLLDGTRFQLPLWARYVGAVAMGTTIPLSVWVYSALGKSFYIDLRVTGEQLLVTHGPYAYVRHPMYGVLLVCIVSSILLSAVYPVLLAGAVLGTVILIRVRREEEMLVAHFGDKYRAYQERVGGIFPKCAVRHP